MTDSNSGGDAPPGCPMHAGPPPKDAPRHFGKNEITYNDYLKIPELLALQKPLSEPAHHDELLFIVIHQAYELWFKLILHEMDNAILHMGKCEVLRAHHFMKRIVEILRLLVPQIHILETMAPAEFVEFRDNLMPASGFQSTQFREVEFLAGVKDPQYLKYFKDRPEHLKKLEARMAAKDLRSAYYDMLHELGFPIAANSAQGENEGSEKVKEEILQGIKVIYQHPAENLELYLLSESLVDFDQYVSLWREHHVRVVERVIGFKRGTGGSSGVQYLRSTTSKKCFPLLWEVRTYLEKE